MFDPQRIHDVIELHEKSFALLRWVRASLKGGQLSFAVVHQTTDSALAAAEWIERHLENIPQDARPRMEQLPMFSRLFVSFLTTSFQLNANAVRSVSDCGCRCSYCAYLQAGPNLDSRNPSKKDIRTAIELKRIYLSGLAAENGVANAGEAVAKLLGSSELAADVAMATWAAELLRRSEFASQGEAVLALWRQFAWERGSPKPKIRLTAAGVVAAERKIMASLQP